MKVFMGIYCHHRVNSYHLLLCVLTVPLNSHQYLILICRIAKELYIWSTKHFEDQIFKILEATLLCCGTTTFIALKGRFMFGNCQRPVFSLLLNKKTSSIGHRSCEKKKKEKTHLLTNLCSFR